MAYPAFEPTDEQRRQVELYASCQVKTEEIRALIINPRTDKAISIQTLYNAFGEELERGKARTNIKVGHFLREVATGQRDATSQQVTAAIFWSKCHMGWRQVDRMEVTGANGGPLVGGAIDVLKSRIDRLAESRGENVINLRTERTGS